MTCMRFVYEFFIRRIKDQALQLINDIDKMLIGNLKVILDILWTAHLRTHQFASPFESIEWKFFTKQQVTHCQITEIDAISKTIWVLVSGNENEQPNSNQLT